jgi:hypothetical protein
MEGRRKVTTLSINEAMEVRFSSTSYKGEVTKWQLLASVNVNGTISYTLHRVPRSSCSYALTNLVGESHVVLPMKAYAGWHGDVLDWVATHTLSGKTIYEIEKVL